MAKGREANIFYIAPNGLTIKTWKIFFFNANLGEGARFKGSVHIYFTLAIKLELGSSFASGKCFLNSSNAQPSMCRKRHSAATDALLLTLRVSCTRQGRPPAASINPGSSVFTLATGLLINCKYDPEKRSPPSRTKEISSIKVLPLLLKTNSLIWGQTRLYSWATSSKQADGAIYTYSLTYV